MLRISVLALLVTFAAATFAFAETVEVHFAVIWFDLDEVTMVEFRVDNLPEEFCTIETNWATSLTIGELGYGIAMAFSPGLQGPAFYLGSVFFTSNGEIGENWVMQIMASLESGKLVVVDGDYNEYDAVGFYYSFNCDFDEIPFCGCEYVDDPPLPNPPVIGMFTNYGGWTICNQDLPFTPTSVPEEPFPIDSSGWGLIKSLY